MRLIDADVLITAVIKKAIDDAFLNGNTDMHRLLIQVIAHQPTVDAVPTEFVMENFNLEFVCDELTDDDEWCSERCQYSEPQPECIHRYIDTIWRKEHDKID